MGNTALLALAFSSAVAAAASAARPGPPFRPVATYSIVARDAATGEMGVAVQSHWFSVGSVVPWAEPGVGAVATQSFVEPSYGPLGLERMRSGAAAAEALDALVAADEDREVRQVAMIDAHGRVAVHTGRKCIVHAGHRAGEGYSAQANLMENAGVPEAMARAYENAAGDLADRLLAALEAAEGEGGDIRGRQSAAILIVSGEKSDRPWEGRLFDLRVEDHPDPVGELRRLVRFKRAYRMLNDGDERLTREDVDGALSAYRGALSLIGDDETNGEAPFWVGTTLASIGRVDEALPYLRRAVALDPRWAVTLAHLPAAGLLPDDPAWIEGLIRRMEAEE
ncbi:MAG: DUF1028 domain-containing protein [Candidatus Eisenbacteria bacterium]|nr:DUF1028 domain-containing protein [Candidatus Eisenbacteria bacterium]